MVFGAAGGVAVVVVRRPSRTLVESYLETNRDLILTVEIERRNIPFLTSFF